jgi:hypothetical protein
MGASRHRPCAHKVKRRILVPSKSAQHAIHTHVEQDVCVALCGHKQLIACLVDVQA